MERVKTILLILLTIGFVYLAAKEFYNSAYDAGYWDAIEEENIYNCELII